MLCRIRDKPLKSLLLKLAYIALGCLKEWVSEKTAFTSVDRDQFRMRFLTVSIPLQDYVNVQSEVTEALNAQVYPITG